MTRNGSGCRWPALEAAHGYVKGRIMDIEQLSPFLLLPKDENP